VLSNGPSGFPKEFFQVIQKPLDNLREISISVIETRKKNFQPRVNTVENLFSFQTFPFESPLQKIRNSSFDKQLYQKLILINLFWLATR